jgi:hypothetical protein
LANAIAGTVVAFTDAGTGTHTLTIQMRIPNGAGCRAFFAVQTQPTAGGPNLTAASYTNQAGTAAKAFDLSTTMAATADAYATRILHSGNAAGRYGAFLPMAGGDSGIRSIESFTWSGGTAYTGSGVVALCVAAPIGAPIPITVTGMAGERQFGTEFPSLPRVYDGACLAWLLFGAGATTTASPFLATQTLVWGG